MKEKEPRYSKTEAERKFREEATEASRAAEKRAAAGKERVTKQLEKIRVAKEQLKRLRGRAEKTREDLNRELGGIITEVDKVLDGLDKSDSE